MGEMRKGMERVRKRRIMMAEETGTGLEEEKRKLT